MNKMKTLVVAGLSVAVLAGCGSASAPGLVGGSGPMPTSTESPEYPYKEVPKPKETAGQKNAKAKAEQYLDGMAFSRTGLIAQLKYEGFTGADATYAVDNVKVSWNAQAELKAEQYLEGMSFSRSALVAQLKYDGFSQAQADHGVEVSYK